MNFIFYCCCLALAFYELTWIYNINEKVAGTRKYLELKEKYKDVQNEDIPSQDKKELAYKGLTSLFVISVIFLGLFTWQWSVFLLFILSQLIIMAPLSILFKNNFGYTIVHFLNSILGFLFFLFVIINHYHLKIDILKTIF